MSSVEFKLKKWNDTQQTVFEPIFRYASSSIAIRFPASIFSTTISSYNAKSPATTKSWNTWNRIFRCCRSIWSCGKLLWKIIDFRMESAFYNHANSGIMQSKANAWAKWSTILDKQLPYIEKSFINDKTNEICEFWNFVFFNFLNQVSTL